MMQFVCTEDTMPKLYLFVILSTLIHTTASVPLQQQQQSLTVETTRTTQPTQNQNHRHSSEQQAEDWSDSHNNSTKVLGFENDTIVEELEMIQGPRQADDSDEDFLGIHVYKVSMEEWKKGVDPLVLRLLNLTPPPAPHLSSAYRSPLQNLRGLRMNGLIRQAAGRAAQQLFQRDQSSVINGNPLDLLGNRNQVNMTVDSRVNFRNLNSRDVLDIAQLMNSDCRLHRSKKVVRWVTDSRGLLFECSNGAWVSTPLVKRRRPKPYPVSVADCHESHISGDRENHKTKIKIVYSDSLERQIPAMCRHDVQHTSHGVIDNHISTDPNQSPLVQAQETVGSWTVIQRRDNGGVRFYRSMQAYARGFGKLSKGEYWLGLTGLHEITHLRRYRVRIELTTIDNVTHASEYDRIRVSSEKKGFKLKLGRYIGNPRAGLDGTMPAGDIFSVHNGGKFHTKDSVNYTVNCAKLYGTAFWFRGCWATVNFNGPYINEPNVSRGVRWATTDPDEELRVWRTEIMIQPILR